MCEVLPTRTNVNFTELYLKRVCWCEYCVLRQVKMDVHSALVYDSTYHEHVYQTSISFAVEDAT